MLSHERPGLLYDAPLELKTYDIGITVVLRVTINNPSSVMLTRPVRVNENSQSLQWLEQAGKK